MTRFAMWQHGLGDQANAVHCFRPWLDRGHPFQVAAGAYRWLWESCGFQVVNDHIPPHPWHEPFPSRRPDPWCGSKVGRNLNEPAPLPVIGTAAELWPEVVATRYDLTGCVSPQVVANVAKLIDGLPRPIYCFHGHGVTNPHAKDFPPQLEAETIDGLLAVGSVVYLDWQGGGVRHDSISFRTATGYDVETLYELISQADCLIGIDSGPYHLARLTSTPRVGCWWKIPPWHACLPREGDVNLHARHRWNRFKASAFHIHEVPRITADSVMGAVNRVCPTIT